MKKALANTKLQSNFKSEYHNEWYLIIESIRVQARTRSQAVLLGN